MNLIHGIERRRLKKELSELKQFSKWFLYYHQLDKDMTSFFGSTEDYPMTDEEAQRKLIQTNLKIKEIEEKLKTI